MFQRVPFSPLVLALMLAGLSLLASAPRARAQTAPVRGQVPVPGRPSATPRQEPCWQVAGISKTAMEQRHSIEQSVHSQVEAVCADSSLTQQQRQQKIRQIHEQAKQQMDALVTPQQMQELRSCQQARNHGGGAHLGGGHAAGGGHGPCGEMPASPGTGQIPPGKPVPDPENDK